MLWTEPAGTEAPGATRGSTHFSLVRFGETAWSEIRRFVVVQNKGSFSTCMYGSLLFQTHGSITFLFLYLNGPTNIRQSNTVVQRTGRDKTRACSCRSCDKIHWFPRHSTTGAL